VVNRAVSLICPVRGCGRPLSRHDKHFACPSGHSFDIAHSGYVNLLQPQERRSARPGDSAAVLDARRRFQARGFEAPLIDAVAGMLALGPTEAMLDIGCGDGHHLAALATRFRCEGHGVDISVAAIDAAARQYPALHWIVANADRVLPYAGASFHVVTSITARRNRVEFRRVLRDDGTLLVVVPAPDDLIELREAVLGERVMRDRVTDAVAAFAPLFTLERHERLRHVAHLDAADVRDAMAGTYRALRASQRERLGTLGDADVTLSRDALLFRPARAPRARARPSG
jgi:23S rRNA (guanine745-N1)-methyltransferase